MTPERSVGEGPELEVTPETVLGSEFSFPAIVVKENGGGFGISGLVVPKGWEAMVEPLNPDDLNRRQTSVDFVSNRLEVGRMSFSHDSTGLFCGVWFTENPEQRLVLDLQDPANRQDGVYVLEGTTSVMAAIALQWAAVRLLMPLYLKARPGYGCPLPFVGFSGDNMGGWYSSGLAVPKGAYEDPNFRMGKEYQRGFQGLAGDIARGFGVDLKRLGFNWKGFVDLIVVPGDACSYVLGGAGVIDPKEYVGHNVDAAERVLTLHGIAAAHLNGVLKEWRSRKGERGSL